MQPTPFNGGHAPQLWKGEREIWEFGDNRSSDRGDITAVHFDGERWSTEQVGDHAFTSMDGSDQPFVLDAAGGVWHREGGANAWIREDSGVDFPESIVVVDDNNIWVAGGFGKLAHRADGVWNLVPAPAWIQLLDWMAPIGNKMYFDYSSATDGSAKVLARFDFKPFDPNSFEKLGTAPHNAFSFLARTGPEVLVGNSKDGYARWRPNDGYKQIALAGTSQVLQFAASRDVTVFEGRSTEYGTDCILVIEQGSATRWVRLNKFWPSAILVIDNIIWLTDKNGGMRVVPVTAGTTQPPNTDPDLGD